MHKSLLLCAGLALLAGPVAAQTDPTPPAPTPASTPEAKSPWLVFDQPVPPTDTPPAKASKTTQGANYVPLDVNTYRLIDRYAIKFGPDSLNDPHTSVRPYTRAAVARLGERMLSPDSVTRSGGSLSRADRFNAQYLLKDNWANSARGAAINQSAKPFLTYFYRDQTDFYHVETKDFTLRVNPVLLLEGGKDSELSGLRYVNTRGVQIEGTIDQKLGFYTFLTDNQEAVPGYVQTRIQRDQIVPHEGFWKYYKNKPDQYDFFTARGGITYAAGKHINLQLAHDRNFIGNGYRSLILSDYSTPYFFLKINTRVWKFNYQNLFAEMTAQKESSDQVYPKKYMALHHLSFDVTPNFNIGVFESTIFGSDGVDSLYTRQGGAPQLVLRPRHRFEAQYLNPVIFYRAIEQQVGSADNAILGLDFKWNILHTAQLYGQLVLDEFKISEIRAGNGWWGNKQAFQLGGKYIDVAGLRNLDLQVEFNYVRPYTYQHEDIYTSYQHYQQPLAHPMGANLAEILGVLSYQPLPRLMLVGKAFYSEQGLDIINGDVTGANYGGNVLKSYNTRVSEYGNKTAQGNKSQLLHADFTATYQPRLNLFLDAKLIARHQTYSLTPNLNGNEVYASLALRWNIAQRLHEF
ncbi:capsule assembly Wzi family protein [Hymenobacter sp. 5317J-9]|uniref:capsule assembly Wzi family protein n=1 Tax=Hymenobacter sp. 5317J-9 TaxID=2932250 RepID=UPI001FD65222|nr:capsule assembly Wzi family protein [Hymenobacter sp. 5317J-9]UOQ97511.1 capsule assembly Wzi family protein [Hymenobacter sp. 5317J-9]